MRRSNRSRQQLSTGERLAATLVSLRSENSEFRQTLREPKKRRNSLTNYELRQKNASTPTDIWRRRGDLAFSGRDGQSNTGEVHRPSQVIPGVLDASGTRPSDLSCSALHLAKLANY